VELAKVSPLIHTLGLSTMKFSIYSNNVLVGHSELEFGDPPMGVAFGKFEPSDAYANIRQDCSNNHADQSNLYLSAQTPEGLVIPCASVGILDYSNELDESFIEVNVLGIEYPMYEVLFPQHVAAYEQQFKQ
jgi:hypothetical protein